MKIHVTKDDIKKGIRRFPSVCPIALAINRAIPSGDLILHVGGSMLEWVNFSGGWCETVKIVDLPVSAWEFISAFDNGNKVSPFSFVIPDTAL